jgi:uncharacterized glyoxalase superfamily protein PhnB
MGSGMAKRGRPVARKNTVKKAAPKKAARKAPAATLDVGVLLGALEGFSLGNLRRVMERAENLIHQQSDGERRSFVEEVTARAKGLGGSLTDLIGRAVPAAISGAPPRRPSFIASLAYKDGRGALRWLRDAFGFEPSEVLTDAEGNIVHAEMTHGDGVVMIGPESADWAHSPVSMGGKSTQRIHVRIESGIDEHCARSRQAGAKIVKEPEDQFYGDRSYVATDLEGHYWTFSQPVRKVSREEMEKATGFKFERLRE